MFFKDPRYTDDLIMSGANFQNGPAIVDPSRIAASHAAQQAQTLAATENANKRLGLAGRQFDKTMDFKKDQLDYGKKQGDIAAVISGLGLGVSAIDTISARSKAKERIALRNNMIGKLQQTGDQRSLYYADLLKYLE